MMIEDMRLIELMGVTKLFGETEALRDVTLYIRRREFLTLLGPSGCGKTTMLRIIGGFEFPDEGRLYFEGKDIIGVPPYKRRINTVFQRYALFPHMNVFENIAFGLKLKKMQGLEITRRVNRMLALVKMTGFEKREVDSLSGGQQQRIAIARALVNEPEVLLLDEPLGALDLKLRKEMQLEIKAMQQQLGITFIYVTHDQEEALTMSDTVVVMNDGRIQQIGDPKRIYDEPKNAFVADFIGESNIMPAVMIEDEVIEMAGKRFKCVDRGFNKMEPVDALVRPEDVMVDRKGEGILTGIVKSVIFKGVHYEMMIDSGEFTWKAHSTVMQPAGSRVSMSIVPFNIHAMRKGARE
jgi:spermidine/putrescine transport system ATP-binding protein